MAPRRTQHLCSSRAEETVPSQPAGLVGWLGTLLLAFSWPPEEAGGRVGISLTPQMAVSGVRAHFTPLSGSRRPWHALNNQKKKARGLNPGAPRVSGAWSLSKGTSRPRPALPFLSHFHEFFSLSGAQSLATQRSPGHGEGHPTGGKRTARGGDGRACEGPESPAAVFPKPPGSDGLT